MALGVGCISAPTHSPAPAPLLRLDVAVYDDGPGARDAIEGALVEVLDGPNKGIHGTTKINTGSVILTGLRPGGFTVCGSAEGMVKRCVPVTLLADSNAQIHLLPAAPPPPVARLTGRVRVAGGQLVTDAGPWIWFGIADFDLVHLARTGQRAQVDAYLEQAAAAHASNVRVFLQASILFDLHPDQPGYWEAVAYVLAGAAGRGLYVEAVVFCDAQILQPSAAAREAVLREAIRRIGREPGVILEIANEARKNGWKEADDPALLALADLAAALLGHRDFLISDPLDGDDPDVSAQTLARSVTLAKHSNILVLHPSRLGGSAPYGNRWRRWIAHLESFSELVAQARAKSGRQVAGVLDEPIGHAARCSSSRECDPEAALAGWATARLTGAGYTYHRIAAQDAATPGLDLIARVAPLVPATGQYLNDCIGSSPSCGFDGWDKVRWWITGNSAIGIAYGAKPGAIKFRGGWAPVGPPLYDGPHARVLRVGR